MKIIGAIFGLQYAPIDLAWQFEFRQAKQVV